MMLKTDHIIFIRKVLQLNIKKIDMQNCGISLYGNYVMKLKEWQYL